MLQSIVALNFTRNKISASCSLQLFWRNPSLLSRLVSSRVHSIERVIIDFALLQIPWWSWCSIYTANVTYAAIMKIFSISMSLSLPLLSEV